MKTLLLFTVFFLSTYVVFSQGSFSSVDNRKSNWDLAATWSKQFPSMPDVPNPVDVNGTYVVNVYGYVTRNGNLGLSGSSVLNVYDTLVIKGNVTDASSIVVHPGGLLIVLGDFTAMSTGNKLANNGNVVITGEFSLGGGTITSNGKIYSFDLTPTFVVGSGIDGVTYNGSNINGMKNQLKTIAQLNSANAPLASFVNSLSAALPIKLVSFNGSLGEDHVVSLNWVTARELNFDHFEVERASADLAFKKIAQIHGSGYNTDDNHYYSHMDSTPLFNTNYYRLKSVDLDGSFEYSKILGVTVASSKTIFIYPNPSNGDSVNISSNFELDGHSEVMLFNPQGVLLQKVQVTEREMRIDFTSHLSSGIYLLKYTSPICSHTVRLIVK